MASSTMRELLYCYFTSSKIIFLSNYFVLFSVNTSNNDRSREKIANANSTISLLISSIIVSSISHSQKHKLTSVIVQTWLCGMM